VALVGTQAITAEAFQAELVRRAQAAPGRFADPGEKQALLEEMIRFEVLHQKALAAGYDKDPQVAAALKRLMVARFQEDQAGKLAPAKPTAEEIAVFYRNNPQRFGTPERVRAALIEFKVARTATPEKRVETLRKAEAVLAEARTNAPADHTFGLLAQQHSEHQPSRYRGGDLGWLTVGVTNSEWPPAVLEAVFRLSQPGELGPVIETASACYLVRLSERQPAKMRPLAEVQDGIAYLVAREKEHQQQQEFYDRVKQGLSIRINQPVLDSMAAPAREIRPPGLPGGPAAQARSPAGAQ
jgi:hypothetical protein